VSTIPPWLKKACQIASRFALHHSNPHVDLNNLTQVVAEIANGTKQSDDTQTATGTANSGNRSDGAQPPIMIAKGGNKRAWWKTARVYQVLVMYYADSNGDGWGDFIGLMQRLPQIKKDGFNALWIHPIFDGPFRDFVYDVNSYFKLHEKLGTVEDFRMMRKEAHRLGIKIILDIPINHKSVDSEAFQAAIRPAHPEHDKYHKQFFFSDTGEEFAGAAVLFKDFEDSNWFPVRDLPARLGWDVDPEELVDEYYFHRFFFHQADINYNDPGARDELQSACYFLFDEEEGLGVDLLRIDAGPHVIKEEGTSCESLPATHAFYRDWLCPWVEEKFPGKGLLIEANQEPEEVIEYLNDGFKSAFDFVSMPAIFLALARGNKQPLYDAIVRLRGLGLPEWASLMVFLSLHDEKTWEFVKRSERHELWKEWGHGEEWRKQNWGTVGSLISLCQGDIRQVKLLWAMLYGLKGAKLVYSGEEVGKGDTSDLPIEPDKGRPEYRNATRTIYPQNSDRNAGFSTAQEENLAGPLVKDGPFGYKAANREDLEKIPSSILPFIQGLNRLCKEYEDLFCLGDIWPLGDEYKNPEVMTWVRTAPGRFGDDVLLCVYNLTPSTQFTELDLSQWGEQKGRKARRVTEIGATILGGKMTTSPRKASANYPLSLPPYQFMFLLVE
jgi:maltose alpha-D-glucosyltransferase/alpha-amylase